MPMQKKVWSTIFDGGSGQWLWMREFAPGVIHAVRIDDMWDATGELEQAHYAGDLLEVNLAGMPMEQLDDAARCCGYRVERWADGLVVGLVNEHDMKPVGHLERQGLTFALVEMCVSYGAYAPLDSLACNSLCRIERAMKCASREMDSDPAAREAVLDRPVNALGSTAREYAAGDFDSALARGLQRGDANAKLVAKIEGKALVEAPRTLFGTLHADGSLSNQASVNMNAIPSDDPIAFMCGYQDGAGGSAQAVADEGDGLAPAYVEGFDLGKRVRDGRESKPSWVS